VEAVAVLHRGDAAPLARACHDRHGAAVAVRRRAIGPVDLAQVVAVDLDRVPPERPQPLGVGAGVPPEHRLAALAEPVDVDDRDQVVEPGVARAREPLPHRALGELAVAGEDPHASGQPVEPQAQREADADRQAEPERARCHVDPRQPRGGVTLEPAAEAPVRRELHLADGAGGTVHRVQQR